MWKCNLNTLSVKYQLCLFLYCDYQISPSTFISENYYEVDGVLTTKLEKVNVEMKDNKTDVKCLDDESKAVIGKGGVHYLKHGAFCLETQKFPDAVHHVCIQSIRMFSL